MRNGSQVTERKRMNLYLPAEVYDKLTEIAREKGYASPSEVAQRFFALGFAICEAERNPDPENGLYRKRNGILERLALL